jgi:hypothetical protein
MTTKEAPARFTPPKDQRAGDQPNRSPAVRFYQPDADGSRLLVYLDAGDRERRLGSIEQRPDSLTFCKTVHGSRHLHRLLNAWGLQSEAIRQLRARGVLFVEVKDAETNVIYRTTLERLESEGILRDYQPHGPQLFLPLHRWSTAPLAQPHLPFEGTRP